MFNQSFDLRASLSLVEINAAGMSKLHISTADTESIWHTWSWRYSQVVCDWVSIASLQDNFLHCRLLNRQFLNWDLIVAFIPFNSQITMATVSPRIAEFHDFLRNEQLRLAGQRSTSRLRWRIECISRSWVNLPEYLFQMRTLNSPCGAGYRDALPDQQRQTYRATGILGPLATRWWLGIGFCGADTCRRAIRLDFWEMQY
jgi:hypothetical protein